MGNVLSCVHRGNRRPFITSMPVPNSCGCSQHKKRYSKDKKECGRDKKSAVGIRKSALGIRKGVVGITKSVVGIRKTVVGIRNSELGIRKDCTRVVRIKNEWCSRERSYSRQGNIVALWAALACLST